MRWIRLVMGGVALVALLAGSGSAATTGLVVGQTGHDARMIFDVDDVRLQCSEWDLDWLSLGPAGYGSAGGEFTVGPDGAIYATVWAGDLDGDPAYIGVIKAVEDTDGDVTIDTLHQETFEWDVSSSDSYRHHLYCARTYQLLGEEETARAWLATAREAGWKPIPGAAPDPDLPR